MSKAPLPTTVLGGFLGAGKTTLVNRILRDPRGRRIAVMVNDFGAVSVDSALIASGDGPVVSLANGCLCCSLGGDLSRALNVVLGMASQVDHLLIEASGVADPARVADIARAEPELSLNSVVTLVDATQFDEQRADHRICDLVLVQLRSADLLLLNKTDLAENVPRLELWLRDLLPSTPVISTHYSEAPFELIFGDRDTAPRLSVTSTIGNHEAIFARWTIGTDRALTHLQLNTFLESLPTDVLRLKGWVSLSDQSMLSVQKVGSRCDLQRIARSADLVPATRLTAIGFADALEPAYLDRLFMTC